MGKTDDGKADRARAQRSARDHQGDAEGTSPLAPLPTLAGWLVPPRDPASLAAPLREVVRALDANQPVFNLRTFSDFYQQRAIAVPRMTRR